VKTGERRGELKANDDEGETSRDFAGGSSRQPRLIDPPTATRAAARRKVTGNVVSPIMSLAPPPHPNPSPDGSLQERLGYLARGSTTPDEICQQGIFC